MEGVMLAGTRSGVGKTVATLVVCRALEGAGETVQPAKAGPDFIDPSHHAAVTGRPSRTLDPWLQGTDGLRRNYYRPENDGMTASTGAATPSVCVVEGVMGMYDGDVASTAAVADALDLPVVLVVDAKAGMESVAATALGFERYADHAGRDVDVVGVLAQRAHGGRHADGIRNALPDDITFVGRIPPNDALEIPDRHLGLHMGDEAPVPDDALDDAATHVDVRAIRAVATEPPRPEPGGSDSTGPEDRRPEEGSPGSRPGAGREHDVRIAIAQDDAFRFVYPAVIERLRDEASVIPFAPVDGDPLPDCDGVYLPGGYPERHAAALADAPALDDLADRASDGLPILGECGGLMALAESLETTDGETHEMAGILPTTIRMHDRYQALDHVELTARDDTLTAHADGTLRGHEFHYSSASPATDARFAFDVDRGTGITDDADGLVEHRTLGTYAHVHAASGAFDRFVETAASASR